MADFSYSDAVVVGSDGSELCTQAVLWAGRWAQRHDLDVVVLTAQDHPVTHPEGSINVNGAALYAVVSKESPQLSTAAVHGQAWACAQASPGVRVWVGAVHHAPADALREVSEVADLTVIGGLHRGGPEPLWGGSVSENVTRTARGPLVVVPHDLAAEATGPVVVGVDDSRAAEAAVAIAVAEARLAGVDLVAVHAYAAVGDESPLDVAAAHAPVAAGGMVLPQAVAGGVVTQDGFVVPVGPEYDEASREQASALVEDLLRPYVESHPELRVVRALTPDDAVDALADASTMASLLVVGGRELGGWRRLFHRSTSRQVSLLASCPVLVVPERALDE